MNRVNSDIERHRLPSAHPMNFDGIAEMDTPPAFRKGFLRDSFGKPSLAVPHDNEPAIKNLIADDASTKGMSRDEYNLKIQSGNYDIGLNTVFGRPISDEKNPGQKQREKKDQDAIVFRRLFGGDSIFSPNNVLQRLSESVSLDQSWMDIQKGSLDVRKDQMLHIKDGKVINPADDPEGKYLVRTLEEKRAYEQSIRGCSALFAQEEVTVDNGRLVNARVMQDMQSLQSLMERKNDAHRRVERGEIDPQNLDEDLKKEIEDRTRSAAKQPPAQENTMAQAPQNAPAKERERVFTPAPAPAYAPGL